MSEAEKNRPQAVISGPDDFANQFNVSRETIHRLERYAALLAEWQSWTNLVAPSTLPDIWPRHFADSAQLTLLAPAARLWLDLGSGAGFPALVVAILKSGEPGFKMHVVESNQRKCRFMGEVAAATAAPVEIHAERIENLSPTALSGYPDIVSARALAPLPRLLGLAKPFFGRGPAGQATRGVFMKGQAAAEEIEAARAVWTFDAVSHPSLTAPDSTIVEVTGLRPAQRGAGGKPQKGARR